MMDFNLLGGKLSQPPINNIGQEASEEINPDEEYDGVPLAQLREIDEKDRTRLNEREQESSLLDPDDYFLKAEESDEEELKFLSDGGEDDDDDVQMMKAAVSSEEDEYFSGEEDAQQSPNETLLFAEDDFVNKPYQEISYEMQAAEEEEGDEPLPEYVKQSTKRARNAIEIVNRVVLKNTANAAQLFMQDALFDKMSAQLLQKSTVILKKFTELYEASLGDYRAVMEAFLKEQSKKKMLREVLKETLSQELDSNTILQDLQKDNANITEIFSKFFSKFSALKLKIDHVIDEKF